MAPFISLSLKQRLWGFFGKYYIVIYMQTMLYNSPLMRIHDVKVILTHFCINIYTKYFRTLINQAPPSPFLALSWGVTLNLFMLFADKTGAFVFRFMFLFFVMLCTCKYYKKKWTNVIYDYERRKIKKKYHVYIIKGVSTD